MSLCKDCFSKSMEESDASYEQDEVNDSSASDPELFFNELNPKISYCKSDSTFTITENSEDNETKNNQKNASLSINNSEMNNNIENDRNSVIIEEENVNSEEESNYERYDEDYHKCHSCVSNLSTNKRRNMKLKKYFTSITFMITVIQVLVYLLMVISNTSSLSEFLKPNHIKSFKTGAPSYYTKWYGYNKYSFIHNNWLRRFIKLVIFNIISINVENRYGKLPCLLVFICFLCSGYCSSIFCFLKSIYPILLCFLALYVVDSVFDSSAETKRDFILLCSFLTRS